MSNKNNRQTILVVDDAPENIDILSSLLSPLYKIKVATNGKKALKIASSENPPDLVLLDIMMPGMNGYEVCMHLKKEEPIKNIPVIFLTAKTEVAMEAKGFELGASDYITKPISPPLVLARVKTQLALYDQNRILEDKVLQRTKELNELNEQLEKKVSERTQHLQQAQTRLIQSEKMAALGKLVAGVTHEVNTPLGALASSIDTIDKALFSIEQFLKKSSSGQNTIENNKVFQSFSIVSQCHQNCTTAINRIESLITSLKKFARIDQSKIQMFDLHEGLDDTLKLLNKDINGRIQVVKDYTKLPLVSCNPCEINQVYLHLIQNAVEAILGDGKICITTKTVNNYAQISIADTGPGIQKDKLDSLFDLCFTSHNSRVKVGMGLATCFNIMQGHKGDIRVKSEIGKGSVFSICLPL